MSWEMYAKVRTQFRETKLTSSERLVLWSLGEQASSKGEIARITVGAIARDIGCSARNVRHVLKSLREKKVLECEQEFGDDGSCNGNKIRLNFRSGPSLGIRKSKL